MKLEFRLLVIDDDPGGVAAAVAGFGDYLGTKGFSLNRKDAQDLSEQGIRNLARREGREYDLVIVDYNLGRQDTNGAMAAKRMRAQLPYTDIIFYSSDRTANLLTELAKEEVAGVFVADRGALGDALNGVADHIVGKAVDLNHMRGIAMAEVADMDVLMEEILDRVFSAEDTQLKKIATRTLTRVIESARGSVGTLEPIVASGQILDIVRNSGLFSSAQKYMAIRRAANCLVAKPTAALKTLNSYEADIINNRNTLAHAKEEIDAAGNIALRSIKRGESPVVIDDAWMVHFRTKLHTHRTALTEVCDALGRHVDSLGAAGEAQ
jgi:CheY-like chemotaxis protein